MLMSVRYSGFNLLQFINSRLCFPFRRAPRSDIKNLIKLFLGEFFDIPIIPIICSITENDAIQSPFIE